MKLSNKIHLTYCTNIHSERNWEDLFVRLKQLLPAIKKNISPNQPFGVGLRLSDNSARELLEGNTLLKFKQWLSDHQLYVFTLNGFPYGKFHNIAVKDNVHKPDWTTRERVEYTNRLSRILAVLLPQDMDGGISTSPLSYKPWYYDSSINKDFIFKKISEHLASCIEEMLNIRKDSGKILHLDIEPEPDGLIENTSETISFFRDHLIPNAVKYLVNKTAISIEKAEKAVFEHIRICYDLCHFALQYEDHEESIRRLSEAGIKIGKVQLSSALKYRFEKNQEDNNQAFDCFDRLNEKTYLHQVVQKNFDSSLTRYTDLPVALGKFHHTNNLEWRVHFHVPLFCEKFGALETTQNDVKNFLSLAEDLPVTQLEIETYTWEVMPGELKIDLTDSISKELEWVKERLEVREITKQ